MHYNWQHGLLSGLINSEVIELLPLRLLDSHKPSTVEMQLNELLSGVKGVSLLIIQDRTSAFMVKDDNILYVDSHLHPPSGAVLVSSNKSNLHKFCNFIWTLESNDVREFGNIVRTFTQMYNCFELNVFFIVLRCRLLDYIRLY